MPPALYSLHRAVSERIRLDEDSPGQTLAGLGLILQPAAEAG